MDFFSTNVEIKQILSYVLWQQQPNELRPELGSCRTHNLSINYMVVISSIKNIPISNVRCRNQIGTGIGDSHLLSDFHGIRCFLTGYSVIKALTV